MALFKIYFILFVYLASIYNANDFVFLLQVYKSSRAYINGEFFNGAA